MNIHTLAFVALAGVSAFSADSQARPRELHYEDSYMYAQPQNDAAMARAPRADAPRTPRQAPLSRDQEIGNNANGS